MTTNIKVPYILTCRVTGLSKAYTSKEFVQRKIENYGGDEQRMINGYVTRDAKRLLKAYGDDLTEANVAEVIEKLKGSTDAKAVFELIKSGALFLTKKVKVRAKSEAKDAPSEGSEAQPSEGESSESTEGGKVGAGASKKGRSKTKAKKTKKS